MSVVESVCNKVAILENGVVVEQGIVEDIFSRPKSQAAKNLVFPELQEESGGISDAQKNVIRVVFNGAVAANQPMVAALALEKNIKANICWASTKSIGEKAYGSMILGFASKEEMRIATDYLSETQNVIVNEI